MRSGGWVGRCRSGLSRTHACVPALQGAPGPNLRDSAAPDPANGVAPRAHRPATKYAWFMPTITRNATHYALWYYIDGNARGVAVADNPIGPFKVTRTARTQPVCAARARTRAMMHTSN